MPNQTTSQKVRAQLKRLKRKQVRAELARARFKKKERSAETHGKHGIGVLADLAGWPDLAIDEADHQIFLLAGMISSGTRNKEFRKIGRELFQKARDEDFFEKRKKAIPPDEWKAVIRYRIILGGIWVKYGMGAESKALLLGAMYLNKPDTEIPVTTH